MLPALLAIVELLKSEWPTVITLCGGVYGWEMWRGQRLTNKKLKLELKALSLALRREELERVAQEITGKELPKTSDAIAAFRTALEEWARGKAIADVNAQLDQLKDALAASAEALAEFSCPFCRAPLASRGSFDLDEHTIGSGESYECGYTTSDYGDSCPCPSDPKFPRLDEFEFITHQQPGGQWSCWPKPLTANARRLSLRGLGPTEQDAIARAKADYENHTKKRRQ
jgi:hypothetical protein